MIDQLASSPELVCDPSVPVGGELCQDVFDPHPQVCIGWNRGGQAKRGSFGGSRSRRRFSPSYKLRIVEEADRCTEPGEVGQVLRREGLYSSHLTTWRKAAHSGSLKALSKKRGRKPERNPLDEKVRKLERRNARLENELRKAHLIIDVQGKVAGLLGISLDDGTNS